MRALCPLPQSVAWAEGIVRAAGAPPKGCLPCGTTGKPRPLYRLGSGPVSPIASTDDIDVDFGKQVMEFLRVYDNLLKPVKGCSVVWDRQTLQVGLLWDRGWCSKRVAAVEKDMGRVGRGRPSGLSQRIDGEVKK